MSLPVKLVLLPQIWHHTKAEVNTTTFTMLLSRPQCYLRYVIVLVLLSGSSGSFPEWTHCHRKLPAGCLSKRQNIVERYIVDQPVRWCIDPELCHSPESSSNFSWICYRAIRQVFLRGLGDMNQPQVSPGVVMNVEQLHSPPASLQWPPALCKPPGLVVPRAGTSVLRHSTGDHHSSSSHVVWHKQIIAGTKVVSTGLLTLRETNHKRVNWN